MVGRLVWCCLRGSDAPKGRHLTHSLVPLKTINLLEEEKMPVMINSPNVKYTEEYIESVYEYHTTSVEKSGNKLIYSLEFNVIAQASPHCKRLEIRTQRHLPKLGLMLVGWGGNNGSTLTAAILANKLHLTWETKEGPRSADWYGSLTQSSTWRLGSGPAGESVYVPMWELLPMVSPDNLVIDGWDINGADLATAMTRAQVLDWGLQQQLKPHMEQFKPRASVFNPDFIAANQNTRADNVVSGSKWEQVEQLRRDIRDFKTSHSLDKVIVVWTASTERFTETLTGLNDTAEHLMAAIKTDATESTYINGSPQNTFVNGCVELAEKNGVFIAGDDFKSGQTKLKSVLVDLLVSAGIKPVSIVSYNHLGNNDGRNLSSWKQFRSKEISKSNVVDDMVESNKILFKPGEKPDHCVVIKYVPYVGDSKRAMDEYTSEILMGGHNTLVIHNTCEDSLLASPIILDLVLLAELCSRITFKQLDQSESQRCGFNSVLSILNYFCKAPLVPPGEPVVNALSKQRACLENVVRACLGLQPEHSMLLEHKLANPLTFEPQQPAWAQ
uniref:inositol-3-phosphate synthase n=1 Tax=Timema monikensis TaxID=170555 RepID=A0A7R9EG99_9NEOP|nr:unnamed protein product [Timema monikensis]